MKKLLAIVLTVVLLFACGCQNSKSPEATEGKLYVYYIDVGQADSILIKQGDSAMLIDGGNVDDGPDVVKFIKKLGINTLDAVVATHAHEDHAGGLATVIGNFKVKKVYSPVNEYSSKCFDDFVAEANKQCGITLCKKGEQWNIGNAHVSVLWPINPKLEETNNTSLVLKLKFGDIKYLFTGDMEHDAETRLVETGADLKADVLKVGHHGSNTSSSYLFLRKVLPQIAIISCGKDNSYGHPHKEIIERYRQAEAEIFRTDEKGTITVSTDGKEIFVAYGDTVEGYEKVEATPGLDNGYIGNKNSKKFHTDKCLSLPKEENRIYFKDRNEAVEAGYLPCGSCNP